MNKFLAFMLTLIMAVSAFAAIDGVNSSTATRIVNGNTVTDKINDGLDSSIAPPASIGDPVIAYSDLIYAPNTGWSAAEPLKGAVVTIWGRNFGTLNTRGSDYVTVNGTNLTASASYVDTWAELNNPTPFYQTVTFQLDNTISSGVGTISITVGGTTSNTVPFEIGTGNIAFVSASAPTSGTDGTMLNPYDCTDFKANLGPGNVTYFRGGTYDGLCNGGKSVIWLKSSDAGGSASKPASIVGFPSEDVYFDALTSGHISNFNKGAVFDNDYMTLSKIRIASFESAVRTNDYSRIIGNDLIGTTVFNQGAGIIQTGQDGVQLYSNAIHGGRSGKKLDHAIYNSGCNPTVGIDVAGNYVYDNDYEDPLDGADPGYGALMSDNHQELRCDSDEQLKAARWHHNLVSCENFYARSFGIFDQSWDPGSDTAGEPQPALIYSNVVIGCGVDDTQPNSSPDAYHNEGHAAFWANSFIDTNAGLSVNGGNLLSTSVISNVFMRSVDGTAGTCIGPATTNSNNAGQRCAISGTASIQDADLEITYNSTLYNPVTLGVTSPLFNAGSDNILTHIVNGESFTVAETDFYLQPYPFAGGNTVGAIQANP